MSGIDIGSPVGTEAPPGFERRRSRAPFLILGVTALTAFVAIGFNLFTRSVTYYRTPTEVLSHPGERVRISGTVVPGSISTDPSAGTVTFDVTDSVTTVTVVYSGPRPDTLQDEGEAVAEGSLNSGVFQADTLFAKCPSKFEAKT